MQQPESGTELVTQTQWAAEGLWSTVPWLVLLLTVAAAAVAWGLWLLIARLALLRQRLEKLDRLDDLKIGLKELADGRGDLDLRRLEHVLIDIRDGQRRVEDALLRVVESGAARGTDVEVDGEARAAAGVPLAERVVNRLLAMGYERVKVVGACDDEAEVAEIAVEARRDGVMHKGRVLVREGVLTDVSLQAAYGAFP